MRTAIALIGWLAQAAIAETVHGVVIFTRHGDRAFRINTLLHTCGSNY